MNKLRKEALLDLKHMLSDGEITKLFILPDEREVAKYTKVCNDGSIVLGKTKYPLWNKIFNGEIKISVSDVCIRLNESLTGSNGVRNKQAFYDIFKDIASSVEKGDYSYALSRIFIGYRLGFCSDAAEITTENKPTDGNVGVRVGVRQEQPQITLSGIGLIDGTGKPVVLGSDGVFRNLFR